MSLDDLLAYIARVGPAPIKDRARGEPHPDLPDVIRIPVSHGRYALIDAEDYPLVMAYSWWSDQYAFTQHRFAGKVHVLRMHRLILMLGSGSELVTDHIDHDGLNNRKTNLRACIVQQNNFNGRLRRDSTTGVKGVTRRGARWRAAVKRDGVVHLACFDSENEAAAWARSQREKLHGEFACHE